MSEPVLAADTCDAPGSAPLPVWPIAVAILSAILMATGGIIALVRPEMLLARGAEVSVAVRTYADYLVSRNLVIAAILLTTLAIRARRAAAGFMILAAIIQFVDAILDCFEGRWILVPSVLIIGVALLAAAKKVGGQAFWKRSFWSD